MSTTKAATQLFDRTAFAQWLRAQEPEAVVGLALHGDRCPMATYITAITGVPSWVLTERWAPVYSSVGHELPAWAVAFVAGIDGDLSSVHRPITAAEASAVLAGIPEDWPMTFDFLPEERRSFTLAVFLIAWSTSLMSLSVWASLPASLWLIAAVASGIGTLMQAWLLVRALRARYWPED